MKADNVVVMLPKAMKFEGGSTPWVSVTEETDAQTYVARNIAANDAAGFTVSGQGQLPRQTTTAGDASQQDQGNGPPTGTPATGADANADAGSNTAATDRRPGGGLGVPIDTPDPLTKYKYWIIAGILLALAGGAGFLLSRPQTGAIALPPGDASATPGATPTAATQAHPASILHALRDELFTLESDRLTGRMTQEQYARVKPALEIVLQNALERSAAEKS